MAINTAKLVTLLQFQNGLQAAKDYTDKQDAALQTVISALEQYVGTLPEGVTAETIVAYIQEKTAGIATDAALAELQAALAAVEGNVDTLVAEDTGKSVREIAIAVLTEKLIPADAAEARNSLEEIAAWIQEHPEDAAAMNAAITALQAQLEGIDAGSGTVKKYVDDAIAALAIGDYAKAADLTALAARVTALETDMAQAKTDIEVNATAAEAAQSTADTAKTNAATAQSGVDALTEKVDTGDQKVSEYVAAQTANFLTEDDIVINVASDDEVTTICNTVFGTTAE